MRIVNLNKNVLWLFLEETGAMFSDDPPIGLRGSLMLVSGEQWVHEMLEEPLCVLNDTAISILKGEGYAQ